MGGKTDTKDREVKHWAGQKLKRKDFVANTVYSECDGVKCHGEKSV